MYIKFSKVKDVKTPKRSYFTDAGLDLFIPKGYFFSVEPGKSVLIESGIKIEIPIGYCGIIMNKSSVATKLRLIVGAAVIDSGFEGEIKIDLHNIGDKTVEIEEEQKIAQLVIVPIICPELIKEKESNLYKKLKQIGTNFRGEGGFGSTGDK